MTPPPASMGLDWMLAETLAALRGIRSPFADLLEAPEVIRALYGGYEQQIRAAGDELRAPLLDMAVELVAMIWDVASDLTAEV